MRKKLIAGNWKMYKTTAEAVSFAEAFQKIYSRFDVEAAICAPFTQLDALKKTLEGTEIRLGAQNVHFEDKGAFTGEISAPMLKEIGVDYTVVGHSERREYFAETDITVNKKVHKLFSFGIIPIMCVGEKLEERDAGKEFSVVENQLVKDLEGLSPEQISELVIAYEPIWAIGTGRTASPEQAEEMCAFIRTIVAKLYDEDSANAVRIQYGGSVKPDNASDILMKPNVDGALVGGASLVPEDFNKIVDY